MTSRIRSYVPRLYGTLKEAVTGLVEAAGGIRRAAALSRVEASQMHAYTDPAQETRHMPVDIAVVLMMATGCRAVLDHLAGEAGCVVVDLPAGVATRADWAAHLARVAEKVAHTFADGARFLSADSAGGEALDPRREAPQLLKDVDEALAALAELRGAITAMAKA